jgi:hypothetical protein
MSRVNQSGANAAGDIVAGDKTVNCTILPSTLGIVEQLKRRLQSEMDKNDEVRHRIESLQYFYERRSTDGIDGLEAKLAACGKEDELVAALEKKELFVKLLSKWSMYASAQEIFAFLLARIEYEFTTFVYPKLGALEDDDINEMVDVRIVQPTIQQCGVDVFTLNHASTMGMVYWLAEQCFVRWH